MAVSVTYKEHGKSFLDWTARNKRMILGTLTLSTYSTSGMTCSIGGFYNLDAIFFQPMGSSLGYTCQYTHSTSVLRVFGQPTTTAAGATECATDTEAACFTAVTFLAIGRD